MSLSGVVKLELILDEIYKSLCNFAKSLCKIAKTLQRLCKDFAKTLQRHCKFTKMSLSGVGQK
jgi:hypothetical protein